MINLDSWLPGYMDALRSAFGERLCFVGLQGSYSRGEAGPTSDIDLVVILESLDIKDIQSYNALLDSLPNRELCCGFLSGLDELQNWSPSDLFHLYYDTKPIFGSLDRILPPPDAAAIADAVKNGLCNIYHGCVHNMLYGKSETALAGLYKSACFVVQALCFEHCGKFYGPRTELLEQLAPEERQIVQCYESIKLGGGIDFAKMSEQLFLWAQKLICNK